MQLNTKFDIDDRVEIIELSRTGTIIEIAFNGIRCTYLVRYFDDARAQNAVFYADEIRKVKTEFTGEKSTERGD